MLTLHILGHIWTLNGWEATLATGVIAFHDIILWPIFFMIGAITGKKVKKPKRLRKEVKKDGEKRVHKRVKKS